MSDKTIRKIVGQIVAEPIEHLHMNPDNVRDQKTDYDLEDRKMKELVEDIKMNGILQPLVILDDGMILFGNRRYIAAKTLGLKTIPCITRTINSEAEKVFFQMSENMVRKFPDPISRGRAYATLMKKYKLSEEDLSKRTGDSDAGSSLRTFRNLELAKKKMGKKRVDSVMKEVRKRKDYSTIAKVVFKRMGIAQEDQVALVELAYEKKSQGAAVEAVAQELQNSPIKGHTREEIEVILDKAAELEEHNVLVYKADWEFWEEEFASKKGQIFPTLRHYIAKILKEARMTNLKKGETI